MTPSDTNLPKSAYKSCDKLVDSLRLYESRMLDEGEIRDHIPVISGSFNDWEPPTQMVEIRDFAHRLDKKKPEFIKKLVADKRISKDATTYQNLTN